MDIACGHGERRLLADFSRCYPNKSRFLELLRPLRFNGLSSQALDKESADAFLDMAGEFLEGLGADS
jgi:hypothetical protein